MHLCYFLYLNVDKGKQCDKEFEKWDVVEYTKYDY